MIPMRTETNAPATQPGIRNALVILAILSQENPLTFSELLKRCGDWPKSKLVRHLKPLQEENWVVKTSEGLYAPGRIFLEAAHRLGRRPTLSALLAPVVDQLAQAAGQTTAFVEWAATGGFTFILKKEMPDSYHHLAIGKTNPAILTHAFGTLALACQSRPTQEKVLRTRCCLPPEEVAGWLQRLSEIREDQFLSGCDNGLRFAAPVYRGGEFCGVLGLSMIPRTLTGREHMQYRSMVTAAAEAARRILDAS